VKAKKLLHKQKKGNGKKRIRERGGTKRNGPPIRWGLREKKMEKLEKELSETNAVKAERICGKRRTGKKKNTRKNRHPGLGHRVTN